MQFIVSQAIQRYTVYRLKHELLVFIKQRMIQIFAIPREIVNKTSLIKLSLSSVVHYVNTSRGFTYKVLSNWHKCFFHSSQAPYVKLFLTILITLLNTISYDYNGYENVQENEHVSRNSFSDRPSI